MTRAKFTLGVLLMLLPASIAGAGPLRDTSVTGQSGITAAAVKNPDIQGTWSGTFNSKHKHIAPFTLTLVIDPGMIGHIIGKSGITSSCLLGDMDLYVTVDGSDVDLAGTDKAGNHITFEGNIEGNGKKLNLDYVTNGSASGKCESDAGKAHLDKK